MSYSVLSGCGNCSIPDVKDIDELEPLLYAIPFEQRPYNIYFTNSLFKKCMPQYEIDIENPYNFNSFRWTDRKRKKHIDIDVMANSIIACCNLIERLLTFDLQLENPNLIVYILYKTASNQAQFIRKYLKVGNIFYNGEDSAEQDSKELHIQITADSPDIVSQFAVFHAYSALLQLNSYNLCFLSSNEEEILVDINILPSLLTSFVEDIEQRSSKELSLIGLHLTEIYKTSQHHTDTTRKVLNNIAKELCRRTSADGVLQRNKDSEEIASTTTTTNSLNLLSQLAYMFASKSYYETSHKIYENFSTNWNNEGKLFKTKNSNKQRYSIKDVAAITAALFSFLRIVHDINLKEILQRQIIGFTETTLIKSGIFNGQYYPILQHNKMEHHEDLVGDTLWTPVFNKGFEYKISKRKYYCDADVFRADYVLPACVIILSSINS
jgi:hypothetical protein